MAINEEVFQSKRAVLAERTARALGVSLDDAVSLLQTHRQQSVRLNTLIEDRGSMLAGDRQYKTLLEPTKWIEEGFYITASDYDDIKESSAVVDGGLYIQNAASWLPVIALDPQPGETVLDMCAAPGGKTSHIAQRTQNQAIITANDNSRPRLMKLQRNMERLGAKNVTYTLHDAANLAYRLKGATFSKILLDAPCSGEGMMNYNSKKDFESWSVAHIKRLQKLQKKLIVQAWHLLEPGGTLVYSTCTMAPEENEAVIDYLLRHNTNAVIEPFTIHELNNKIPAVMSWNDKRFDARISSTLRLAPSQHVEAFFVAKITKQSSAKQELF